MSPRAVRELIDLYSVFKKFKTSSDLTGKQRRSWAERLFSRPWRPWESQKVSLKVYLSDQGELCMPADMKNILEDALLSDDFPASSV